MTIAKKYGLTFRTILTPRGSLSPTVDISKDANGDLNRGIAFYLANIGSTDAQNLIDWLPVFYTERDPNDDMVVNYPVMGDDIGFYINQNTLYPNTSIDAFYATFNYGGTKSNVPVKDLISLLDEWKNYLISMGIKGS
ncbi:MAG: hypothetical protein F9K23_03480 [Bacteroidetes bacterium]|nr:MAG: hypothetical protein F9K23_03480 [Bacteroidota bacterium]